MSDGVLLFARLMPCVRPSHPQTSRFVPPRTSKRLSCSASSGIPRQSSFLPQASPSSASARPRGFGSARSKIPASSRREFLSKAPIFLWNPRLGVVSGARLSKNPCYSLLFRDFCRDGLAADWEHSQLSRVHTGGTGEPSDRKGPRVARVCMSGRRIDSRAAKGVRPALPTRTAG